VAKGGRGGGGGDEREEVLRGKGEETNFLKGERLPFGPFKKSLRFRSPRRSREGTSCCFGPFLGGGGSGSGSGSGRGH